MLSDFLQSFIFSDCDIRGSVVKLDDSFGEMTQHQDYQSGQQQLLAQFIAASLLMSSHIKFDGLLSLQARSASGELMMAECNDKLQFRGIVRGLEGASPEQFHAIFQQGALAITLEPKQGQRYQGVVPLEGKNLAACLALYFEQSEQLSSWFYFCQQGNQVAALMLQALPASDKTDKQQSLEDWQRITHLASTLSAEEMLTLDSEEILYRLYHEENVRLFDKRGVQFACTCSRERMERALINLPNEQLQDLMQEQENVETQCQFCHQRYVFSRAELSALLQGKSVH